MSPVAQPLHTETERLIFRIDFWILLWLEQEEKENNTYHLTFILFRKDTSSNKSNTYLLHIIHRMHILHCRLVQSKKDNSSLDSNTRVDCISVVPSKTKVYSFCIYIIFHSWIFSIVTRLHLVTVGSSFYDTFSFFFTPSLPHCFQINI